MRPLVIGVKEREAIRRVVGHATANRVDRAKLDAVARGDGVMPTHTDPGFHCGLPVGFRVAFTVESQPGGWCRHLSASVDSRGRVPHPRAVEMLMAEFGFAAGLEGCTVYFEPSDGCTAVNVVEGPGRFE